MNQSNSMTLASLTLELINFSDDNSFKTYLELIKDVGCLRNIFFKLVRGDFILLEMTYLVVLSHSYWQIIITI